MTDHLCIKTINVPQFVGDNDALTLAASSRFSNPKLCRIFLDFFRKQIVLFWKDKSLRQEVEVMFVVYLLHPVDLICKEIFSG
jgi:hypothetical protein